MGTTRGYFLLTMAVGVIGSGATRSVSAMIADFFEQLLNYLWTAIGQTLYAFLPSLGTLSDWAAKQLAATFTSAGNVLWLRIGIALVAGILGAYIGWWILWLVRKIVTDVMALGWTIVMSVAFVVFFCGITYGVFTVLDDTALARVKLWLIHWLVEFHKFAQRLRAVD